MQRRGCIIRGAVSRLQELPDADGKVGPGGAEPRGGDAALEAHVVEHGAAAGVHEEGAAVLRRGGGRGHRKRGRRSMQRRDEVLPIAAARGGGVAESRASSKESMCVPASLIATTAICGAEGGRRGVRSHRSSRRGCREGTAQRVRQWRAEAELRARW